MNSPHTNRLQSFKLHPHPDQRGILTAVDLAALKAELGFEAGRIFWITDVPAGQTRGTHAHTYSWEALLALNGEFKLKVDNGHDEAWTETVKADGKGVVIPPLMWCELYDFTPGTVCLCIASDSYDEEGYLKDYEEFMHYVKSHG